MHQRVLIHPNVCQRIRVAWQIPVPKTPRSKPHKYIHTHKIEYILLYLGLYTPQTTTIKIIVWPMIMR